LLLPRPLRTVRAGFPAHSSSLHERPSRNAVVPSPRWGGSPAPSSVARRRHRDKPPARVGPEIGGLLPGHVWGASETPRGQKGPSGGPEASAACLGPPSRYAPGADGPCVPGAAPDRVAPADISASPPESVGHGSLVTEDHREVGPLSRGVMSPGGSTPVRPATGRPFACSRILYPPRRQVASRLPFRGHQPPGRDGLTTFRRCNRREGVGGVSPPVARRLRGRSSEPPSLATYLLVQACQPLWLVLSNTALSLGVDVCIIGV
jgi:hypothetical protein